MSHARGRNEDLGVTGALAWNGRNFCQVLEGEADTVRTLVTQIAQDDRHAGFKVLDEKTVAQRRFDGWSMKRVDALDFSEVINAMND